MPRLCLPQIAPIAIGLLLVAGPLAGCIGGTGSQEPGPSAAGPGDQGNLSNATNETEQLRNKSVIEVRNGTPTNPNSSFHPHDYWDVGEEHVLIDTTRTIDWGQYMQDCLPREGLLCYEYPSFEVNVPIDTEDFEPNMVFPGTGRMNVTLEWESQTPSSLESSSGSPLQPGVCIVYTAQGSLWCEGAARGDIPLHTFSEPGTWTITDPSHLNEDTTDPPHSVKSDWRFKVWACNPPGGGVPCAAPNAGMTEFNLKVSIFRGERDLPLDPPHFDFYGDRPSAALLEDYTVAADEGGQVPRHTLGEFYGSTQDEERVIWYVTAGTIATADQEDRSEIPIVAPGTQSMTVKVRWKNAQPIDLGLKYRTAMDNWHQPWRIPQDPEDCSDDEWSCESYTIPVTELQQDTLYAQRTDWQWGISFQSDQPIPLDDHEVRVGIDIHKNPAGGAS